MQSLAWFIIASILLLATPGPTNTLLAVRGFLLGMRSAFAGIFAEMLGYAIVILALLIVVAPIVNRVQLLGIVVQIVCSLYLGFVAWRLWNRDKVHDGNAVTWQRVFIATLTNPKALVFAFVILPPSANGIGAVAGYGLILLTLIGLAGAGWTMIGAIVRPQVGSNGATIVRRVGSVALVGFSLLMMANAALTQAPIGRKLHIGGLFKFNLECTTAPSLTVDVLSNRRRDRPTTHQGFTSGDAARYALV